MPPLTKLPGRERGAIAVGAPPGQRWRAAILLPPLLAALPWAAPAASGDLVLDLALEVASGHVTRRGELPLSLETVTADGDRGATGIWIDERGPVALEGEIEAGSVVDLVLLSPSRGRLIVSADRTQQLLHGTPEPTPHRIVLEHDARELRLAVQGDAVFAGNVQVRGPGLPSPWPSERPAPAAPARPPKLVILVSCDTLRADALSAYGAERLGTPHLDRLARRSRLFVSAHANSPWTLPSHMTLLTGLLPGEHRVTATRALPSGYSTLAERLRQEGWEAAGFATKVDWLHAKFGFGRGFAPWLLTWEEAPAALDRALLWLDAPHERPTLLFIHLYDAHSDGARRIYDAPPPFAGLLLPGEPRLQQRRPGAPGSRALLAENESLVRFSPARRRATGFEAEARELHDAYREGVLALDHAVGRFLAGLDRRGLLDRATILLTADHGEEFLEHGQLLHNQLHDESTHVPFLVHGMAEAGLDRTPVSLADVAAIIEAGDVAAALAASERTIFGYGPAQIRSVRHEQWLQLSRLGAGATALYDVEVDPRESESVLGVETGAARTLAGIERTRQSKNDARYKQVVATSHAASGPLVAEEEKRRLQTLGYVGE